MTMTTDSTLGIPRQAARVVWRRTGKRVVAAATAIARVGRNSVMRCFARADYKRWRSAHGLEEWWDDRTRQIAALVPAGACVIEFGAGRCSLQSMLPPGCTYIPSDLQDRGPGTIVCDLNHRPLPKLDVKPQVAVFSGVLEYIRDVPGLIQWLASSGVVCCIASYETVPAQFRGVRRMREKWRRAYYGYMSSLTDTQLLELFERAGFVCAEQKPWTSQRIYRFVASSS